MIAGFIASFPWFALPALPWYGLVLAAVMGFGCGWPCCGGCEICSDDWTGISDGTDVSTGTACGWTEDAGSWSVSSNTVTTTSANAILRSNTTHPNGTAEINIVVSLKSTASNDLIRVILDYVDASNYHFVEVKIGASGHLKLYDRTSGTDTELATQSASFAVNSFRSVGVCFNDAQNRIRTYSLDDESVDIAASTTAHSGGDGFALATGGTVTGTVTFDAFVAESTRDTCEDCDNPCGFCANGIMPDSYQIDLAGVGGSGVVICSTGECGAIDGTYVVDRCSPCWYQSDSKLCTLAWLNLDLGKTITTLPTVHLITNACSNQAGGLGANQWRPSSGDYSDCRAISGLVCTAVASSACTTPGTATLTAL